MGKNDLTKSVFPGIEGDRSPWGRESDCGCWTCVSERMAARGTPLDMPFIVCPNCGNKRCPKGTHHDRACTNSNFAQQAGSRYGGLPADAPPKSWTITDRITTILAGGYDPAMDEPDHWPGKEGS